MAPGGCGATVRRYQGKAPRYAGARPAPSPCYTRRVTQLPARRPERPGAVFCIGGSRAMIELAGRSAHNARFAAIYQGNSGVSEVTATQKSEYRGAAPRLGLAAISDNRGKREIAPPPPQHSSPG